MVTLAVLATIGLGAGAAEAAPAEAAPPERPYGNALGDGLALRDGPTDPVQIEVCAGPETLMGIDVSYYQGTIDWDAVAADGVSFAWVRVSHSLQFFDPEFDNNLAGARAAGIHTGVYQYFEPSEDPVAQADLLLDSMGPMQVGDMPPMIDVESADTVAPGPYADAIRAWIDRVETVTGVKPFIYTGYYYWNDNVGTDEFVDYPLWIANYNPGCPLIPDYWGTWTIHQYCACESVAGISGDVDGDTFNGNIDDLMGYAFGSGVCGDGICAGETPYDCPEDCPPCGTIGPLGGTIDNGEACYELYGNDMYWHEEAAGEGGSLVWTNATDFDAPSNYAIWRLYLEESGLYEIEVHLQPPYGETQQAAYQVSHAGGEATVMVDQAASQGWVSLGDYQLDAATNHWVRLDDNTGEPNDLEIGIVYDALRLTRLDAPEGTTGGEEGGIDESGTAGLPDDDGLPGGTGGGSTGGATAALPGANGEGDGGCGCRQGGDHPAWWAWLGLPLLLRRRRRTTV